MSHEKLDRNREIHAKHKQGMSYLDLAKEYEISEARVRQIDDQVRYQERHKTTYVAEIATACRELEAAKWMNGRIQHALCQGRLNVKNRWRKLTREDMLKLRNIGEKAADIIEYAQKL